MELGLCFTAWAFHDAGWSSPVAREAHNLEVVRSNRTPATFYKYRRVLNLRYLPAVGSAACFKSAKTVNTVLAFLERSASCLDVSSPWVLYQLQFG